MIPPGFNRASPRHWLATGLGVGLLPLAPGTWGSLLALPLWWAAGGFGFLFYALLLVLVAAVGVRLCGAVADDWGETDPAAIVWDEIAGMGVAMLALPGGWHWALLAFVVFRCFDIFKPWPLSRIENATSGGLGIMLDDLVAGGCALVLVQGAVWYWG